MPIYEYRCAACGHALEALQRMSEGPLRKCPECGKAQLRRLVSAPSFRLKGSGWYETDFKSDAEKKRNLVEKAGAEPAPTDSAKTEVAKDAPSKDVDAKPKEPAKESAKEPTQAGSSAKKSAAAKGGARAPETQAPKARARKAARR
jgi:putative FmdB family regulatory protein